ncbi:hypothetical protein BD770DRAFT_410109 [Pilaira anomala]|nr:hypothetical protein BD770DRAFT_410109 [Pilaira anomala]
MFDTVKVCLKDDLPLKETQMIKALQVLEKSMPDQGNAILQYFMTRVFIVTKFHSVEAKSLKQKILQDDYFEVIEKMPIPQEDAELINLNVIIKKIVDSELISISKIMEGLDLLTQRSKNNTDVSSSPTEERIRIFKIKILSDLVVKLETPTDFDPDILRLALDDIFLVKDDMNDIDLSVIQMILCRTGDIFYERKLYSAALPWYRYTWNIFRLPSAGSQNSITLISKLSSCYEKLNDFNMAYEYMQKCLDDPLLTHPATAEDYLTYIKFAFLQDKIDQKIGKAVIHIKTTVYEQLANDGRLRTQEDIEDSYFMFEDDIQWMVQTAYNLGLFCFNVGRNSEGAGFFQIIQKTFRVCHIVFLNSFTGVQIKVLKILSICFGVFSSYECFDQNNQLIPEVQSIINESDTLNQDIMDPSLLHLMRSLKINLCVRLTQFDKATDLFVNHCRSADCPFPILERMAADIVLDTKCSLENAFITLKNLQTKLVANNIDTYAKWTRIFVSTVISRGVKHDIHECISTVVAQRVYENIKYPQNELYYLIVVTWNQGVAIAFELFSTREGYDWYRLAFTFLSFYRNVAKRKELENNMRIVYGTFKKIKK